MTIKRNGYCFQLHEFDEMRFDVRVHDCTYFLRASTVEEKQSWIDTIEANKVMVLQCASYNCFDFMCEEMVDREWF